MFERFTEPAREVVKTAVGESISMRHGHTGTEHLLIGLLEQPGIARDVLINIGLTTTGVRDSIIRHLATPTPAFDDKDAAALKAVGVDLEAVLQRMRDTFGADATAQRAPRRGIRLGGKAPFTKRAKKVLELSLREAIALKDRHIGTEHILLGLLREGGGLAAVILTESGADVADVRGSVRDARRRAA